MIRAAQTGEVSAITELLELAIGGTQRPEQVQAWIDDPNRVVLVDHKMRGVILGTSVGGEAEITDVAVTPEHRRTGIGTALIRAFVRRPTGDATQSVFLEVRVSNSAAIALYRGEGFCVVGRREGYYEDGEDALVLRWETS